MFQHKPLTLSLLLFASLPAIAATASHSAGLLQSKAPYYFVSDSLTLNNKAHILTYTGHVKVDQGKTHLTGDKLVIHLTPQNEVISLTDYGQPATYSTVSTNHPGIINAHAKKITYLQAKQMIYLDGKAEVEQNHNHIRAAHITYDKLHDIVHSHGDKHNQHTHIVVMPTAVKHT